MQNIKSLHAREIWDSINCHEDYSYWKILECCRLLMSCLKLILNLLILKLIQLPLQMIIPQKQCVHNKALGSKLTLLGGMYGLRQNQRDTLKVIIISIHLHMHCINCKLIIRSTGGPQRIYKHYVSILNDSLIHRPNPPNVSMLGVWAWDKAT